MHHSENGYITNGLDIDFDSKSVKEKLGPSP